ncbi:MAG: Flp pilus assembly complex ATPase component TadA [Phycisphaeraceae bacterium]|nr:Flp pilus assembly complex ATPase component TadA [Phycisphaeraceae bacterium]
MPLGALLLNSGTITQAQLDQAVAEQRSSGERLDRVLIRLGLVAKERMLAALGEQFHMPVVDLPSLDVDQSVIDLLPSRVVFRQRCAPVRKENGTLTVAVSDPYDMAVVDELRMITGSPIDLVLADEEEISRFIRDRYGVGGDTLDALSAGIDQRPAEAKGGDEADQAQEATLIRLVNDLLAEAISERATDVHIEPYEHELIVRYRIDGVLERANVPPTINRFAAAIVSRLKIMANLNIAEKRRPQDGRITFRCRTTGGPTQEFDLRLSIIPMLFGEGVVLRVLSKSAVLMSLDDLGMPAGIRDRWSKLIERPHGIMLVTGPTGSGKSTTLYASLNRIVSDAIKVITVEDPVEYHVPGVNQIQVNHKVGLDFASGLRSILRHDPDVVMIGEIRDKETAETAVQASLTGHLVFSTLHTNDSAGAVTRLLDMGVEPFLVSSSLEAVLAQRLVRRICDACAHDYTPDPADVPAGLAYTPGTHLRRGAGCRACRQSGYRGRLGVYELLTISDNIRHLVTQRSSSQEIVTRALADSDLSRLIEDGFVKVLAGRTTIEEVLSALSE